MGQFARLGFQQFLQLARVESDDELAFSEVNLVDIITSAREEVWGMAQETWDRFLYPDTLPLWLGGAAKSLLERTSIGWNATPLYLAFGGIIGMRVGLALLIGSILFFGVMPASLR